ncbi:ABC transporter substrate-binding protein [Nocardioides sp.]|uniref:ABC transporter substrate-binding protein n=1 Tax=Nocardioides sp. TaxID=35761 RepID=UPI00271834F7|nr:ABC transporter substrate-binding protein [Nocardioides sp.]MDO9458420.1 ABC transporter substrate-binding protein [Nocardioides sp.]
MLSATRPTLHPPRRRLRTAVLVAALTVVAPFALTGCGGEEAGPRLAADAAIPDEVPKDTVLRIGDPATQVALELSGLDDELPFEVEWANISGGPKTLEAFRADALDVGSVADIPPLFAKWTGTDVKIVAARYTVDPLEHPTYELGIAPGVDVDAIEDLKGKKIAYSPGQAQGAIILKVLQEAGLTQDDVELVEMASTDDVYVNALGSKQVDVAPLGQTLVPPFLAKYEQDGGHTISPGVRDDFWHLYAPTEVLEDANKAAALKKYTEVWAEAVDWVNEHPEEYAKGFYEEHEGLSAEDAAFLVDALGQKEIPQSWDEVIVEHQKTADLLAEEQDRDQLDVAALYDRRFEPSAEAGKVNDQAGEGS